MESHPVAKILLKPLNKGALGDFDAKGGAFAPTMYRIGVNLNTPVSITMKRSLIFSETVSLSLRSYAHSYGYAGNHK